MRKKDPPKIYLAGDDTHLLYNLAYLLCGMGFSPHLVDVRVRGGVLVFLGPFYMANSSADSKGKAEKVAQIIQNHFKGVDVGV